MGELQKRQPASIESVLGSLEHIRSTLERARVSISVLRREQSRSELPSELETRAAVADASAQVTLALWAQLRASITAYVRRLRDDGVPPEQTLVHVKVAVREATPPELAVAESRALMDAVVQWSIETYFETVVDNGRR